MKRSTFYVAFVATILFPFLAAWTCWIMTAFSFNIYSVFDSGAFWGFTLIYYTLLVWIPLIALVDHYETPKIK